ncbi:MAG: O-antigen ligase family protein [Bacteroidetes bacterium]|nr:O-antigen ligase family protein [Bacteroidota bacterium]
MFSNSENTLLKLIDYTNLFEFISIGSLLFLMFLDSSFRKTPRIFKGAIIMFVFFYTTCFFSLKPTISFVEVSKLVYYALIGFAVYHLARIGHLRVIYLILIYSCLIFSMFSIYDYFGFNYGLPTINRLSYGVNFTSIFGSFVSTANYFFLYLLILFPQRISGKFEQIHSKHKYALDIAIVLASIVLLGTGRVSILFGYAISLILILLFYFNRDTLKLYGKIALGIAAFGFISYFAAPKTLKNISYRFESRIFDRKQGTPEADFILDNFQNTWRSFSDNPMTGSGLGAFKGYYAKQYVHGTYLKLIGEMGLVGVLGYVIFIFILFKSVFENSKEMWFDGKDKYIILSSLLFMGGCFVAWGYNEHLIQKMFWVFLGIYFYRLFSLDKELVI